MMNRRFIYPHKVDSLILAVNTINERFGKTVFLIREEAEAALREL